MLNPQPLLSFVFFVDREKDYRIAAKRIKRLVFRPNDQIECNVNGEGKWYQGIVMTYREDENDKTYDVSLNEINEGTLPSTIEKVPGIWLRNIGDPLLRTC